MRLCISFPLWLKELTPSVTNSSPSVCTLLRKQQKHARTCAVCSPLKAKGSHTNMQFTEGQGEEVGRGVLTHSRPGARWSPFAVSR
jgi:hypothetical protein